MTEGEPAARRELTDGDRATARLLPAAFLVMAAAALAPLWSVEYPPMVDLPQHAAVVFIWKHYSDPAYGYREIFQLDLFSPYLIGHALARLAAVALPVPAAMKAAVSLAVLALPLALAHLLRRAGGDPWGALLGFPLAYGFAFYWGFTNYLLAVPVGLAFAAAGLGYARAPSRRKGAALALFAFVLYSCHALAFALCVPIVAAWILAFSGFSGWRRLWPLAPAAAVIAVWVVALRLVDPNAAPPLLWSEPLWQRLAELPKMLVGAGRRGGPWLVGGLLALALPWVGARWRGRPAWRWIPVATALALYLAAPNRALGTWFVYPRFAVFAAAFVLLVLEPASARWRRRLGRGLVLAFAAGWMVFLGLELRAVDAEARGFDAVIEHAEPGRRLLGLVFDPGYEHAAGLPVFAHFHMWYLARKGGLAEYTFGIAAPQLIHYRPGAGPLSHPELSLHPERFDFRRDGRFDYFLVRSRRDLGPRLFAGAPVVLEARSGAWWLYRRVS